MTHARRYVVSSQLWLTIVRAGLCRRFGETKRDPARISERAGKTPVMAAFRRRLEATDWERTRQSHVCSPHFVSLDFINDVEYYGLRKETSLQQDCCPNLFSIKTRSRCRNAHSVNRWTPRLSLAGPAANDARLK